MPLALIVVSIASVLGVSIFAFTDAGEEIARPISESKEAINSLTTLVLIGLVVWAFFSLRRS